MKRKRKRQLLKVSQASLANLFFLSFFILFCFFGCLAKTTDVSSVHYSKPSNTENSPIVVLYSEVINQPDIICTNEFEHEFLLVNSSTNISPDYKQKLLFLSYCYNAVHHLNQSHSFSTKGKVQDMLLRFVHLTANISILDTKISSLSNINLTDTPFSNLTSLNAYFSYLNNKMQMIDGQVMDLKLHYPNCYRHFFQNYGDRFIQMQLTLSNFSLTLQQEMENRDKEHERYLNKIKMVSLAHDLVKSCESEECKALALYNFVTRNLTYYPDPNGQELIRGPSETLAYGGGDCEDLAILFVSLAKTVGLDARMAFTEDHAFAVVCSLDMEKLASEIKEEIEHERSEYREIKENKSLVLKPYFLYWTGFDGSALPKVDENDSDVLILLKSMNVSYEFKADHRLYVDVVPSSDEFEKAKNKESFSYYPACSSYALMGRASCIVDHKGGVLIRNLRDAKSTIAINITFTPIFFVKRLRMWMINGCVVFELTGGENAWPGWIKQEDNTYENIVVTQPISFRKVFVSNCTSVNIWWDDES